MTNEETKIENYAEFWDFYVREHIEPLTRYLHFVGTTLGIVPLCFVVGYAFAWFAHFFVEHNKPATFKYPFWAFISDYKMVWFMLTGRMNREVERVSSK